jgi:hypothetical protein
MIALAMLSLALVLSGPARTAQAHGGGTLQLTNAAAGPYRVSAWTQPDPARAGTLHLSIAVSAAPPGSAELAEVGAAESEAGDVVLDAAVRVQVQPLDGAGETLTAQASRQDSANKFLYEADMELPDAGQWRVEVQVEGPAGVGVAGFDLQVLPAPANPLAALGWPLWAGLGLVVALGVWLVVGFSRPATGDRRPVTADRRPTTAATPGHLADSRRRMEDRTNG